MAEPVRRDEKGRALDFNPDKKPGEHEATLAKEKYDPALKSSGLTQAQVKATGGLGAYAKKNQAKPKTKAEIQAEAVEKGKPK